MADRPTPKCSWQQARSVPSTCEPATPTNKSDEIDTFDFITFRDGKIIDFHQCTDTALVLSLAAPE